MRRVRRGIGRLAVMGIAAAILVVAGSAAIFLYPSGPAPSTQLSSGTFASSSFASVSSSQSNNPGGPNPSSSSSSSSSSSTNSSSTSTDAKPKNKIVALNAKLFAGTLTSASSRGTGYFYLILHDSGAATTISSINIFRPSESIRPTVYQCPSATSCSPVSAPIVNGNTDTNFTTPDTEFFVGAEILPNTVYGYLINFENGTTVLGSVTSA